MKDKSGSGPKFSRLKLEVRERSQQPIFLLSRVSIRKR